MNSENIIILILSTKNKCYNEFKDAIRLTWKKRFEENGYKIFFYEGDSNQTLLIGDTIHLECGDELQHSALKLKIALRFIAENFNNWKIIYRTNLSSYIEYQNFNRYISPHSTNQEIYIGPIGNARYFPEAFYSHKFIYKSLRFLKFGRRIIFCSGSGFFIGKNHVNKIISSTKFESFVDDLMVPLAAQCTPSAIEPPIRLDYDYHGRHIKDPNTYKNNIYCKSLFHYRFKSQNRSADAFLLRSFDDENFRTKASLQNLP